MSGTNPPAAVTTVAGSPLSGRPVQAAVVDTDQVFMLVQVGTALVPSLVSRATLNASVLALAGGTMTGPLVLSGPPILPEHAATKAYTDALLQAIPSAVAASAAAAAQSAEAAAGAVQAARGAGDGVAALDASKTILITGRPALGMDEAGHLVFAALIEDTNDGFQPVAGSRVLYTDGGIPKVAL